MRRVFIVVAGVAVAAGCVRSSTHKKVLAELKTCQGDLGACKTESDGRAAQITTLEGELVETRKARDAELEARKGVEAQLGELSTNLQATQGELDELRKQKAATQKRLEAFRELNEKFRQLVDTGKLEVAFRNGMMVLKLPAGVLFPSGKHTLSKDGETALTEVLGVLGAFRDRRFVIAGHTDDRAIKTAKFADNWDLSTARAATIVRFMIEGGFDPKNLGAAGYGEFDPVADNATEEGRQLNRRIEIILVPDLSELPNLTAEPD